MAHPFKEFIQKGFCGRLYPFDEESAFLQVRLAACGEKVSLSVDPDDLMIAVIAQHLQASIATRNIKDFEGGGITLINTLKFLATNIGSIQKS